MTEVINFGDKHWKPGSSLNFQTTHGTARTTDLPDYIGWAKINSSDVFYFRTGEVKNLPKNEDHTYTLTILTIPEGFIHLQFLKKNNNKYEFEPIPYNSTSDPQELPAPKKFILPIMVNLIQGSGIELPKHFCISDDMGLGGRVNEACAFTMIKQVDGDKDESSRTSPPYTPGTPGTGLSTVIERIIFFQYQPPRPGTLVDGLYDFTNFYFVPLILSNQSVIYYAFKHMEPNEEPQYKWLKDWKNWYTEVDHHKFFTKHHFLVKGPILYLDDLDILITFNAELIQPKP